MEKRVHGSTKFSVFSDSAVGILGIFFNLGFKWVPDHGLLS